MIYCTLLSLITQKPLDPLHTDTQSFVHVGYIKTCLIHFPQMLHNPNEQPDQQLRRIHLAPGHIYSPYSIRLTSLYYITRYPIVSHCTPTYFHSGDDTYTCQSESMCIHHADIPATNRTLTISLSSTWSLVMPIVNSHSVSVIIH